MINDIVSCPYYTTAVMCSVGLALASFIFKFVCDILGRETPKAMKYINIVTVALYFVLILPLIILIFGCLIERGTI